jgi:hypothetical protein
MNFNAFTFAILDVVSAAFCFILVWIMTKLYRYTGENQYLGLPVAFSFLGASFVIGLTAIIESAAFVEVMRWLQVFTQSYAFAFLAMTYYLSRRGRKSTPLKAQIAFALILLVAVISLIIVFVVPIHDLPPFNIVNDSLRIFNIVCLSYVAITALLHVSRLDPMTVWIYFGFLLFDFSQYSFLIWSVEANTLAFLGGYFLRFVGLVVFMVVTYKTFYSSAGKMSQKGN